jgi:glucosamine 6-phosphate synthetase-like amidotransferase/phosphosugar isomerase protein
MCGIFGYFGRSPVSMKRILELLRILENHQYEGEVNPVGGHGAGICFYTQNGKTVVHKVGKTNSSPTEDLSSSIKRLVEVESRLVLGHVIRASDEFMGTVNYREAAQPYKAKCLGLSKIFSAHNGKIENYQEIRKSLSKKHCFLSEETVKLIDSEVVPHLFEENLMVYCDEEEAAKRTIRTLEGNNTVVMLSLTEAAKSLHVIHKGKTRGMHLWKNEEEEIVLCSRNEPLKRVFGNLLKEGKFAETLSIEWKKAKEVRQSYKILNP